MCVSKLIDNLDFAPDPAGGRFVNPAGFFKQKQNGNMKTKERSMMKKQTVAWLTAIFVCAIVAQLAGCGPNGDRHPEDALYIYGWTNGTNAGAFCYADIQGNVIATEGLAMPYSVSEPAYVITVNGGVDFEGVAAPGEEDIDCTGVTGAGGYCMVNAHRDQREIVGYRVWQYLDIHALEATAGTRKPSFAYASLVGQDNYFQELASISGTDGQVIAPAGVAIVPAGTTGPAFAVPEAALINGNFTSSEIAAASETTVNPPTSGIDVVSVDLAIQSGYRGQGYSHDVSKVMPINLQSADMYLKHASPYFYSYIFKTASPMQMDGYIGQGIVTTDAVPDGILTDVSVIANSADGYTHTARTSWFLPVDDRLEISQETSVAVYDRFTPFDSEPNIWDESQYAITVKDNWLDFIDPNLYADPNIVPDPNVLFDPTNPDLFNFDSRLNTQAPNFESIMIPERVIIVPIIPMNASDDTIQVEFVPDGLAFVMMMSEVWLTDDATCDLNEDGIVNYLDWQALNAAYPNMRIHVEPPTPPTPPVLPTMDEIQFDDSMTISELFIVYQKIGLLIEWTDGDTSDLEALKEECLNLIVAKLFG